MRKAKLGLWLLLMVAVISGRPADRWMPASPARFPPSEPAAQAGSDVRLGTASFPPDDPVRSMGSFQGPSALYPLHPGFPVIPGIWIEKAPATIADINNDGNNELLVPTYDPGRIYVWNAAGSLLPGYPITAEGRIRGRLALGDLNHDGKLEIAAGVESSSPGVGARVSIWRSDGALLSGWPQNTACYSAAIYCGISTIMLADIDNDTNLEVIAGTDNRDVTNPDPGLYVPNLYVWRNTGQLAVGKWPVEDDYNVAIVGAMAVGDLNGDGKPDIATGRDYNRLFAYDNQGNDLPGWPVYVFWPSEPVDWTKDQIEFARSAVTLADLDADGTLEYIVPGLRRYANSATYYNTELLVYASNGKRWRGWETPASGTGLLSNMDWRMLQAPAIADLNGDKRPDIVVSTQDGWVRAYTPDQQLLWSFNYAQGKLLYASEPVIGDVDGDGSQEVLFGTFDANYGNVGPVGVWILDHTGVAMAGMPLVVAAPGVTAAPALADLDHNGKLEIAAADFSGRVYVWDAPGPVVPARLPWPMARYDLQRTGLFVNPESDLTRSVKAASTYSARYGDTVTYTLQLMRTGAPLTSSIQLTDVIPLGLSYISGTLTATAGLTSDSLAPTLRWTGLLSDTSQVKITYAVTVTTLSTAAISNSATIDAGSAGQLARSVTLVVNGREFYLPIVYR